MNHPNIAQIYGLEQADTSNCIVKELVEGETLAERIGRGPVALGDTNSTLVAVINWTNAFRKK